MTLEFRIEPTKKIDVIVASHRSKRPKVKEKKLCPFDAGHENMTPKSTLEVVTFEKTNGKWSVRSMENKFPFLSTSTKFNRGAQCTGAYGVHEVIVETPDHEEKFENFTNEQLKLVFETYVNRFKEISEKKGVEYVFMFKNYGKEAGASINHEHSQIVGLPFVPQIPKAEFKNSKSCIYCRIAKQNIVFQNAEFSVVRPSFARFPLECWVIPKKHRTDFTEFGEKTSLLFMKTMQEIVRRIKKKTNNYNVVFHNSCKANKIHFHVEIYPKTSVWAGLELGTGVIVNTMDEKTALKELS